MKQDASAKPDPLKIVSFQAENIKRLKAVTIVPDPGNPMVVITGKNGQGKTSIIDSIWMGLGGQSLIPSKPIRNGETEGSLTLDLGQFIVQRRFKESGNSYLEVKTKEGFSAKSPQTFLTSRLGDHAQNPLAFMDLKPEEQVTALQGMIDIKLDLEELGRISGLSMKGVKADDPIALIDNAYSHLYEKRTEVNKEVKRLEGAVKTSKAAIPSGKEGTEKVSVVELFEERKRLEDRQRENNNERVKLAKLKSDHEHMVNQTGEIDRKIEEYEKLIAQLRDNRKALTLKIDVINSNYEKQAEIVTALVDPDFTDIEAGIAAADATNEIAGKVEDLNTNQASLDVEKTKSEDLTARLAAIKDYKGKLIIEAGLPVEGLGFENGEVTYNNGIPLKQASTAEQVNISCAICMASHPGIGVLTVDRGWADLDSDSKKVLVNWAERMGVQIWVTRVTDDASEGGFFIEDGELKAIDGVAVPAVPVNGDACEACESPVVDSIPF